MDYWNTVLHRLLASPQDKLIARGETFYFLLEYFDRAPDKGRYRASWGADGKEIDFVTAYDLTTLVERAKDAEFLDEHTIPLEAWQAAESDPAIKENTD